MCVSCFGIKVKLLCQDAVTKMYGAGQRSVALLLRGQAGGLSVRAYEEVW